MSLYTAQIERKLEHERRERRQAWESYHRARREHRPLAEMNALADAIERHHASVVRLIGELRKARLHDAEVANDVARLRAEASKIAGLTTGAQERQTTGE